LIHSNSHLIQASQSDGQWAGNISIPLTPKQTKQTIRPLFYYMVGKPTNQITLHFEFNIFEVTSQNKQTPNFVLWI
jgi:hypothetical protein